MELKERIGYEIIVCIGGEVNSFETIAESYREATMNRFFRLLDKTDRNTAFQADYFPSVKNAKVNYFRKEMDELIHAIEIGDQSMMQENIRSFYGRMMDKNEDSEMISLNIQYFLYRLLGLAYEQDSNIDQEEVIRYIQEAAFSRGTTHGNEKKFLQFAEDFSDYLLHLRNTAVKGMIGQIEAEIEAKYAENLSLKTLGQKYYINSAYLGQIFKRQYRCNFKDYLNGVRIRKAAEMLLRTDEKVYEIAEKVGYKNMEYFINKFEDVYGATPTRFRKLSCKN
jgi:two-component system response regulator YesN